MLPDDPPDIIGIREFPDPYDLPELREPIEYVQGHQCLRLVTPLSQHLPKASPLEQRRL